MPNNESNLQAVTLPREWSVRSWRARPALQMPRYDDATELESALAELGRLPPLVTSWEILSLKQQLAEAQEAAASCCRAATARRISTNARRT